MFAARPRAAPAREENARAVFTDMYALRVLAGDEIGYVRALQTNPAAADDEAEDLRLVGKFGALDRRRATVKIRAVCELDEPDAGKWTRAVCARRGGVVEILDARSGTAAAAAATANGDVVDAHAWTRSEERGGGDGRGASYDVVVVRATGDVDVCGLGVGAEEWETRATFKAMENATSSDLEARFGRLVIGGKGQGCDVMVYEAETGKRLYKAKPPPPNWLGYRAPPWVSATCFASTSECVRFFVGTGEHRFRHYDTREAKRAVLDLDVGKTVITSVASSLDGSEAYVANARGAFEIIDLRAGKSRGKFRGNSGSIRQISVHPNGAHVACAGLDQYVRVYDVKTRKCVASAYAKQPLTSIVFDAHTPEFEAQNVKKSKKSKKRVDEDLVVDYDVSAKKKKKKKKKSAERLAAEEENAFAKKKKKKKKSPGTVRYDDDE